MRAARSSQSPKKPTRKVSVLATPRVAPALATRARKTSKNQLTLPKAVVDRFPGVDDFDVTAEGDRIVLLPVHASTDGMRARLARAGIDLGDLQGAVAWARRPRRRRSPERQGVVRAAEFTNS